MLSEKIYIVTGATGRVGSGLVHFLLEKKQKVRAVIRNRQKAGLLERSGADVMQADFFDRQSLIRAFRGGSDLFLMTPENPVSDQVFEDTKQILQNCREAMERSEIRRLIGLSSVGAQYPSDSGNLKISYMLENGFNNLPVEKVFVRPSYYFSNWLAYLDPVREYGVLPSFFPVDLEIPMIAPEDVAQFISELMIQDETKQQVYEITGPEGQTPGDVARVFSHILNRSVEASQIPREEWEKTLRQAGFSGDASDQLIKMTEMVISGKTTLGKDAVTLQTSLKKYLEVELYG